MQRLRVHGVWGRAAGLGAEQAKKGDFGLITTVRENVEKIGYSRAVAGALKYRSGEEIRSGDQVLFHGNPAEIELVAFDPKDPRQAWHVKEFGAGVLVSDPLVSGRTFIPKDSLPEYEDLKFVSRSEAGQ